MLGFTARRRLCRVGFCLNATPQCRSATHSPQIPGCAFLGSLSCFPQVHLFLSVSIEPDFSGWLGMNLKPSRNLLRHACLSCKMHSAAWVHDRLWSAGGCMCPLPYPSSPCASMPPWNHLHMSRTNLTGPADRAIRSYRHPLLLLLANASTSLNTWSTIDEGTSSDFWAGGLPEPKLHDCGFRQADAASMSLPELIRPCLHYPSISWCNTPPTNYHLITDRLPSRDCS